jgi:AraC-like DNA-binding protein
LVDDNQWFLKPRLTLTDVSELTGLQTRDISRAINTVANKSFNDYINEYRVKHICQALDAGSPHSLTRLYTDAGFSSKASFNKVFKEYAGITPSAYKAQAEV